MRDKKKRFLRTPDRGDGLAALFLTFAIFGAQAAITPSTVFAQETQKPLAKEDTTKTTTPLPTPEKQPVTEEPTSISQMYTSGVSQLKSGDPGGAVSSLEEVLRRDPTHIPSMINLARAYVDLEQYDQAESTIDKAIASDSANAEAHLVRGRVMQSIGNSEEAISSYRRAIQLDQHNPFAYNNLALIYIQDGTYSEAIPLLEKGIQQKNDVVFFHNNLGIAYEGTGDLFKAEESFQEALNINPGYEKALVNLERVQSKLAQQGTTSGKAGGEDDRKVPQKRDSVDVKDVRAKKDSTYNINPK